MVRLIHPPFTSRRYRAANGVAMALQGTRGSVQRMGLLPGERLLELRPPRFSERELHAVAQENGPAVGAVRADLRDLVQVDDRGAMGARELPGIEHPLELLHRLADEMALAVLRVQLGGVVGRPDPDDVLHANVHGAAEGAHGNAVGAPRRGAESELRHELGDVRRGHPAPPFLDAAPRAGWPRRDRKST